MQESHQDTQAWATGLRTHLPHTRARSRDRLSHADVGAGAGVSEHESGGMVLLDLSNNSISDTGAAVLAAQLHRCHWLRGEEERRKAEEQLLCTIPASYRMRLIVSYSIVICVLSLYLPSHTALRCAVSLSGLHVGGNMLTKAGAVALLVAMCRSASICSAVLQTDCNTPADHNDDNEDGGMIGTCLAQLRQRFQHHFRHLAGLDREVLDTLRCWSSSDPNTAVSHDRNTLAHASGVYSPH